MTTVASSSTETGKLALEAVIGFAGDVPEGLVLQSNDEHLIYPLGSNVVVKDLLKNTQRFLQKDGHDRSVSCLTLSHDSRMLATGQITYMGFPAVVIIWDLATGSVMQKLSLHKGKIQSLAFSCDDKWLATLGGEDDNKLVIWNIETGKAVCGNPASNDTALTVKFFNNDPFKLVTAGKYNLRIWWFDLANRKIRPTDCRLGSLKRVANAILIDRDDRYVYVGTGSGDVLRINLSVHMFKDQGPKKKAFSNGVRVVTMTHEGDILVGAGDGTVALLRKNDLGIIRKVKFEGGVTSIALNKAGDHFFVGTNKSNMHLVHLASFDNELRSTCHYGRINDICFPEGYSELFVTASESDIRVWNTRKRTELLRIQVPNLECICLTITVDGKTIISGWSDGKIRAFKPQSGKLVYVIHDAHDECVSAIAATHDGSRVVSGGGEGRVRIWAVGNTPRMLASLSEHKGKVTCIRIKADDTECVSSCHDGSCIVWDLVRYLRLNAMFASTQFSTIVYHPDESQLLTTGTDRKITYWDAVDGNAIRIIDGSNAGEINSLDISQNGEMFVSSSADKLVKLWGYDEGYCYFYGLGHSGAVKQVAISPDQDHVVSVGEEGAIFIWKLPSGSFTSSEKGVGELSKPVEVTDEGEDASP